MNLKCFIGISALLLPLLFKTQTFNYTVSCDSAGTYQELTADTKLSNDSIKWNFSFSKNFGFAFPFLGKSYEAVGIESNNYIVFGSGKNEALLCFPGFGCKKDSAGHYSKLSSELSGTTPNRIFKLQFSKVGQTEYPGEYLSYQVWLHENGVIDVVIGDHTYPVADSSNYNDTLNAVQIGLINRNMDTEARGLFLKGSPSQPSGQPIDDEHTDISLMRSFGRAGTRYTFSPQ